jgi:hypothetical protein
MIKTASSPTKKNRSVIINDDVLVADMRLAKTAGIVRLSLADLTVAHFYVRNDGAVSTLGFTTGRDDFVVLGVFAESSEAHGMLNEIRREMLNTETYHKVFNLRTLMTVLAVLVMLVGLVWVYGKITQQNLPEMNQPLSIDEQMQEPAVPESGQPMDADSKFNVPE